MSDLIEMLKDTEGHTAGPWAASASEGGWDCVRPVLWPGSMICKLAESNRANMYLIALAPELAEGYRTQAARIAELEAEVARLKSERDVSDFESADWYWRTMDPDDNGDSPDEVINRAMLGRFCVCEIGCSFTGPIRYGFIAPVPDSDDDEFVHFATQQEAMDAARARSAALAALAALAAPDTGGADGE